MNKKILISAALAAMLSVTGLQANSSVGEGATSAGLSIGTGGAGVHYSFKYSNTIVIKGGVNYFGYNDTYTETDATYDYDISTFMMGVVADYHPYENGFFLSGGAVYIDNSVDIDAVAVNGEFDFNDNTYDAALAGTVSGNFSHDYSLAPYLGIGYDASLFDDGSTFFTISAGAVYQGDPVVTLENRGCELGSATCAELQNDLKTEEASINSDIEGYAWWPSIQVGITYRF